MRPSCGNSAQRRRECGFTLMELMIVIIIMGILVGIVVAVFLNVQKKAANTAALANIRMGSKAIENAYFKILGGPQNYLTAAYRNSYRDMAPPGTLAPGTNGYAVNAAYMSYMEPRMIWAYIVPSGTQLYVQNVYTRSGYIVNRAPYATTLLNNTTAGGGRDWGKWLYGNIGIFPYRWTGAAWANTTYYYLTVLALDSHAGVAHYTTYYQGRIFSSGTFAWNDGTGHP